MPLHKGYLYPFKLLKKRGGDILGDTKRGLLFVSFLILSKEYLSLSKKNL